MNFHTYHYLNSYEKMKESNSPYVGLYQSNSKRPNEGRESNNENNQETLKITDFNSSPIKLASSKESDFQNKYYHIQNANFHSMFSSNLAV